jgi:hypothetical protein
MRCVEQDAGYQEAGEDEKEIDSHPTRIGNMRPGTDDKARTFVTAAKMREENSQDRNAAQAVKCGIVPARLLAQPPWRNCFLN